MKRILLHSTTFTRAARRVVKRHPEAAADIGTALKALCNDTFQPSLRTHKLKDDLAGLWACRVGYDLRIVFELVQHDGAEAVLLHTVGTHQEVY